MTVKIFRVKVTYLLHISIVIKQVHISGYFIRGYRLHDRKSTDKGLPIA